MNIEIIKDEDYRRIDAMAESASNPGMYYRITLELNVWSCTCPHNVNRGKECKHIKAIKERCNL